MDIFEIVRSLGRMLGHCLALAREAKLKYQIKVVKDEQAIETVDTLNHIAQNAKV